MLGFEASIIDRYRIFPCLRNVAHRPSELGEHFRIPQHGKAGHGPTALVRLEKAKESTVLVQIVMISDSHHNLWTEEAMGRWHTWEGVAISQDRLAHGWELGFLSYSSSLFPLRVKICSWLRQRRREEIQSDGGSILSPPVYSFVAVNYRTVARLLGGSRERSRSKCISVYNVEARGNNK